MKHSHGIAQPRYERSVSDYVPYSHHVTRTVVATRTWEYVSVWRVDGRSFEGHPEEDKCRWVEELNNLIRGFPAGVGLWAHLVRRKVQEYPQSEYPDAFSRNHDAAYRATFDGKPPMINELYLTTIARASVDPALRLLSRFEKRTARDVRAWQARAIEQLDDVNRKLASALKRYRADQLGIVERGPDKRLYSEPAEFFGLILNGRLDPVPVLGARLYNTLPSSRPFFATHGEQGELRGVDWSRKFAAVELREYPANTKPGHLNKLLQLPVEMVVSQSFGTLSQAEGLAALARQKKWLEDSKDYSVSQIQELQTAMDDLTAGKFVMGDHHATVTVFGEDSDQTLRGAAEVIGALGEDQIIARLVDRALVPAWWAQLPGNWKWRPRPAPITSLNFLCFSSMHNYLFGKPNGNPWGPAVTILKTTGGTPYYLNFHATLEELDEKGKRRLGNTAFIGKSGTGKTVLLGHLLTQARKFGYTGMIFDKDRGLQVAIMAMRGKYFPLRMGVPTGWNYLQLPKTSENLSFMRRLTKILAADGDQPATLSEQRAIDRAVGNLVEFIDHEDRRLSTLLQYITDTPAPEGKLNLRERLERWCVGHENGWVFDNATDALDFNNNTLFGFDLTEFLEEGPVRDAALTYLLYRTDQINDGSRRFLYAFDEVQHPLKVPYFQSFIQDSNRTVRKKDGVFAFATQEPDAITQTPVGKTMIQQSATVVYLPNDKATAADYIDGFKLTAAEFKMVQELGEFSRQFVVKQGDSTVTAMLDLHQCQDALLVFSGSADMAAIAEKAVEERGPEPEQWLPLYLERARAATKK
ncbi:VirB4 family type IV secretion/conjugal transfer ATPase [Achromobacter dolens]|uniref:VirB4 family type IV secretion/conjugal transfer ATPase n=1 Tax=Achromobacter dolens TaxID=1287738 RepID=UPI0022B8F647|nr:VirB4 family type IV secretion/conjugal transfer ATPase [Achromobacter dolens]MCZ8411287.1 VirB4 family type IV secretion/conjugal transfer ATPase [Achromobacter dolens]